MGSLRWDLVEQAFADVALDADVLEVGAGQGAAGARLAQRYRYVGVEPDGQAHAVAAARVVGGPVLHGDTSVLAPGRAFDVVCAFEVLEHIADDAAALRDWHDRLRPGGRLVLSVPAWQHRFAPTDAHVGHHRRYDPDVLRRRLLDAGFTDVDVRLYGFPLGYALEAVRNAIVRRRPVPTDPGHATAASGRFLQPPAWASALIAVATWPFRLLQRPFAHTRWGTGIVATARRAG